MFCEMLTLSDENCATWQMNATLNLNWETGELVRLQFGNIISVATEKIVRGLRSQQVLMHLKLMRFVLVSKRKLNKCDCCPLKQLDTIVCCVLTQQTVEKG